MEKTNADLLIFGASRACHGYITSIFEDSLKMTSYNVGRDGLNIFYQLAMLKSILKRHTPKIIILDNIGNFEKYQLSYDRLSALLPYYRTHEEIRDIVRLKSRFERIKLLSEIYPFNSLLGKIILGNTVVSKKNDVDNKGYVPYYSKWTGRLESLDKFHFGALDSAKINAFHEFLNLSKSAGAEVFVFYSPIHIKIKNDKDDEICKVLCDDNHVPYFNYSNDTAFLNYSYLFKDNSHLNHDGAVVFSQLVARKVKNVLKSRNHYSF